MGGFAMMRSVKYTTLIVVISTIGIFGFIGGSEIGGVTNVDEIKNIAMTGSQKTFQNNFDIDISPHVISVDTGVLSIPAIQITDRADAMWAITQPGQPDYGTWTITANPHPDDHTFEVWWKDTFDGMEVRKDITLNYRSSPQDSPIRTINCIDAIPVSYNPGDYIQSSGQVLVEKIVVKCNTISIQ